MNTYKKRNLVALVIALTFLQVIAVISVARHFYKKTIYKGSDKRKILTTTTPKQKAAVTTPNRDFFEKVAYKDVYVKSRDNLTLHGYWLDLNSDKTVIIVHGYASNGFAKGPIAKEFHDHNFNILCPDLRAHGQSEGDKIAMGWKDHYDLLEWIDLVNTFKPRGKIVLMGVSMGGSTVLNATGENLPANVAVCISDCAFTTPWDIYQYQLSSKYNLPPHPVLDLVKIYNNLDDKSNIRYGAIDMVKKSVTPTLFIHGSMDYFVPTRMVHALHDAASCEKEKLIIKNAGHAQANLYNPELYYRTVFSFIEKYL